MGIRAKKRYRVGGPLSMRSRDHEQLLYEFSYGDVLPDELAASLSKGELAALLSCGRLREIGAPPAPRVVPEPPPPITVAETLRHTAWPNATVLDGRVTAGPRGYAIAVLDKAPRDSDLKQLAAIGGETPVLVHRVDGHLVATISLAKLAQLLATPAALASFRA